MSASRLACVEPLESRNLLSALPTAAFAGGVLAVRGARGHANEIAVRLSAGAGGDHTQDAFQVFINGAQTPISILDAGPGSPNPTTTGQPEVLVQKVARIAIAGGNKGDTITVDNTAAPAAGDGVRPTLYVNGGAGKDTINVGDNDATLQGGAGNDTIVAGTGNDSIDGGSGNDTIIVGGVMGAVAPPQTGLTTVVTGGKGNDTLISYVGSVQLFGGSGRDAIIDNSTGDNTLFGGPGNDRLFGGKGRDTLFGGPGRDTFTVYFNQSDAIPDRRGGERVKNRTKPSTSAQSPSPTPTPTPTPSASTLPPNLLALLQIGARRPGWPPRRRKAAKSRQVSPVAQAPRRPEGAARMTARRQAATRAQAGWCQGANR